MLPGCIESPEESGLFFARDPGGAGSIMRVIANLTVTLTVTGFAQLELPSRGVALDSIWFRETYSRTPSALSVSVVIVPVTLNPCAF